VNLYWGSGEIDRTGENQWNASFIGVLSYDGEFDISAPEAQSYLLKVCQALPLETEIVVQDDDVVDCWIETFKYFVEAMYGPDSFPVP
jgi:hypothetical protein